MKISKEILEIASGARTLEESAQLNGMFITGYNSHLGISRAKTTISPAGKVFSPEPAIDRTEDTISWDSSVNCPVFSSDSYIIRCPMYSESNNSLNHSNEPIYYLVLESAKG
jgi:hypothetical protein